MNSVANSLALAAFVASAFLLLAPPARVPAIFATAASGLELLMAYGAVRLAIPGFPTGLILGAALLVAGVVAYLRVSSKGAISAATIAVLVGAVQVLRALRAL